MLICHEAPPALLPLLLVCLTGAKPASSPVPSSTPTSAPSPAASLPSHNVDPLVKEIFGQGIQGMLCEYGPERSTPLFFKLKRPYRRSFHQLRSWLRSKIGDQEPGCHSRHWIYYDLSRQQAELIFGEHVEFSCLSGAGNMINANAYAAEVTPPRFVPRPLRRIVRQTAFNNDPKFYAVNDLDDVDCTELHGSAPGDQSGAK